MKISVEKLDRMAQKIICQQRGVEHPEKIVIKCDVPTLCKIVEMEPPPYLGDVVDILSDIENFAVDNYNNDVRKISFGFSSQDNKVHWHVVGPNSYLFYSRGVHIRC